MWPRICAASAFVISGVEALAVLNPTVEKAKYSITRRKPFWQTACEL